MRHTMAWPYRADIKRTIGGQVPRKTCFQRFRGACPHSCAQLRLSSLQLLPYGYPPRNYGRRSHLAHHKVRGTRTAETDMCRQRASGRAAGTGPERARAAGCAHRRTWAAGGAGRYSDPAGCRPWADEARTPSRTGKRGRSDRRAEAPARPCQPWRRTPPQPSALRAEARTAMRPHPNAI